MLGECLDNVRGQVPLIHCITNYVTVNDVANVLLACGGSPIMADDVAEVAEITTLAQGLTINIGTLNERTIASMRLAGETSNALGHATVLDPVGAGATMLRTRTATELVEHLRFDVIRGNISEVKTLAAGTGSTKGVDASAADAVGEGDVEATCAFAKALSGQTGAIIAITGAIDFVADAERCFVIRNGRAEMGKITGTGCQLSAMTCAFVAANPDAKLEAAAAAVACMGLAGEIGWERMEPGDGNATYRNRIIDSIFTMDAATLEKGARYAIC